MPKLISRVLLIFVLGGSLLLSGCGFKLRGQINVPESLTRMQILGDDDELNALVGKSLKFSGVEVVENDDTAAVLDLRSANYTKEVIGTNSSGIANNYKLTYKVNYAVYDAQQNQLLKNRVSQDRSLVYDPNNILVFEREERFLVEDMRKELVTSILRQVGKIK
jgi:LPS-assembly lipoprotein